MREKHETTLDELPESVKKMKGFDDVWARYQKWLKKQKETEQ